MTAALTVQQRYSSDVISLLREVYGDETPQVVSALASAPERFYFRTNTLKVTPKVLKELASKEGITAEIHQQIEEAMWVSTRGPNQIPELPTRIVVNKFTAEAVLQGANVYAPGVVSCQGLRAGMEVMVLGRYNEPVAVGMARMSENEVLAFRKGLAVKITRARYEVPNLRETRLYQNGFLYPQSLPSIVVGRVLDPKPEELIVDLTCAPGGKLSHICQLTDNQAKVVGVDRNAKKIQTTRQNLSRLGCSNVTLLARDARSMPSEFNLKADKVLVDPPCSALGLRPKLFDGSTVERIKAISSYQKQFLRSASLVVREGGIIVYSVCTVTRQECEEVAEFSVEECGLRSVDHEPLIGRVCAHGSISGQRFDPHTHGMGYYIAKFRK